MLLIADSFQTRTNPVSQKFIVTFSILVLQLFNRLCWHLIAKQFGTFLAKKNNITQLIQKLILFADSFQSHTNPVSQKFMVSRGACLAIIPSACSQKLQPLHRGMKLKFKVIFHKNFASHFHLSNAFPFHI